MISLNLRIVLRDGSRTWALVLKIPDSSDLTFFLNFGAVLFRIDYLNEDMEFLTFSKW